MNLQRLPIFGLILCLLAFSACNNDPCKDVDCVNGGCREGECLCVQGYEGADCSQQMRDKFLGDWLVGDICNSGSTVYDCSIAAGSTIDAIIFSNLYDQNILVSAQVNGNTFEIPLQAFGQWTIEGSGAIDTAAVEISLDYTVDFGGGFTETCLAAFQSP